MDPMCVLCKRQNEDGAHTFLKCKGVRQIWQGIGLENLRLKLMDCQGPKDLIQVIFAEKEDTVIQCVALLWTWWKARNKINAGEGVLKTNEVIGHTVSTALEYKEFCTGHEIQRRMGHQLWSPPRQERANTNIDGCFRSSDGSGGWGFVIRDAEGHVVGAAAGKIQCVRNALQAEAIACIKAMEAAQDWGIANVGIETDAQVLVQAMEGSNQDLAINGVLFPEIKNTALLNLASFNISFCPREVVIRLRTLLRRMARLWTILPK